MDICTYVFFFHYHESHYISVTHFLLKCPVNFASLEVAYNFQKHHPLNFNCISWSMAYIMTSK